MTVPGTRRYAVTFRITKSGQKYRERIVVVDAYNASDALNQGAVRVFGEGYTADEATVIGLAPCAESAKDLYVESAEDPVQ